MALENQLARERRLRTADQSKGRQRLSAPAKETPTFAEDSFDQVLVVPHSTPNNMSDSSSSSLSTDLARVRTELSYSEALRSAAEQRARDAESKLNTALEKLRSLSPACFAFSCFVRACRMILQSGLRTL